MQKKTVKISLLVIVLTISFALPLLAVTAKKHPWVLDPVQIDETLPGFTWADWVKKPWIKGSGTIDDPYMIKNVVINGEDSPFCLEIWNSEAYFKIMDCIFYNTKPPVDERNAGISIVNTRNGIIFRNLFYDNGWMGSDFGSGIGLLNSENNKIHKNTCKDNAAVGIYMENSDNNIVVDNYCSGNRWGIMLWDLGYGSSDDNMIARNDCIENSETGIVIGMSYRNTVTKNLCQGNIWGISVGFGAGDNTVTQNDCIGNSMGGIVLSENSMDNAINGNDCYDNLHGIILVNYAMNNEIKGNDCHENENGILLLDNAMYNKIEDNLCTNNSYGISLGAGAYYNEISENEIVENLVIGIVLWDSPWGNIIYHNNIIDNVQQAWDNNPWSNNWNENYWNDYLGTDMDGDGIGDTYLPWPIWPYLGWDGYDYAPFVEKDGWKIDEIPSDVMNAWFTGEQRIRDGSDVSIAETNYLIVAIGESIPDRQNYDWSPPYTFRIWLDGTEVELLSFWWDDKQGEILGYPAFWRVYYCIFEPFSLQYLELGWHTLDFEYSYYTGNGPYRWQITGGWSSGFTLVE